MEIIRTRSKKSFWISVCSVSHLKINPMSCNKMIYPKSYQKQNSKKCFSTWNTIAIDLISWYFNKYKINLKLYYAPFIYFRGCWQNFLGQLSKFSPWTFYHLPPPPLLLDCTKSTNCMIFQFQKKVQTYLVFSYK